MDATVNAQLLGAGLILIGAGCVYIDAMRNKIGNIPEQKGFFNLSAGA